MRHQDLHARHRAVMPSWLALSYEQPIQLVRGFERRVVDAEGRTYLDYFGGIAVNLLGYNVPEVREALRRQLSRGVLHTSTLYLIEQQVLLAERVAALSGIPDARVFFVNSGSEAMEAALLFVTESRRCGHVLTLRNGYHGRSFGSNGATAVSGWQASGLSPLQVHHLPNGHRPIGPLAGLPHAEQLPVFVDELHACLDMVGANRIAALVAEPVQGVGGVVVPPPGLLRAYQQELRRHGIPLVMDEVQSGWGRAGSHFWASGVHEVEPDLMTFAKGLGNGLGIGGVVGRAELVDSVTASSMSTFGGNPLAMSAGLATLDVLLRKDLQANAQKVGETLRSGLERLAARRRAIGEVRGLGLLLGIEIVAVDGRTPDPVAARAAHERTRELGLLVGRGGPQGNVLRISPALTTTVEEAYEALGILDRALAGEERDA